MGSKSPLLPDSRGHRGVVWWRHCMDGGGSRMREVYIFFNNVPLLKRRKN